MTPVLVAGLGVVSRFWLPPLAEAPELELVAVVEPDAARLEAAREQYGLRCPAFSELASALAAERPDLVINLTPPVAHRAIVGSALEAGCHVWSEKPLAATFEEARELVELAAATDRTLCVMQNRRYQPGIRRLRAGLESTAIGEPVLFAAEMFMAPRHRNTFIESMRQPLLFDLAVHTFDQVRYLSGRDAVSVDCRLSSPPGSWYAGPALALCSFELEDGVLFSYRASCVAAGFATSYDAAWRISGTRGTAVWDSFGDPACEVASGPPPLGGTAAVTRRAWANEPARDATGHTACLDELRAALRDGRPAATDCRDNIRSLAMAFAAVESAHEGRRVPLERFAL
jgi:predicted dehydrogenase